MKTKLLIFFFAFVFLSSMIVTNAYGWCPQNEDWPDAPCYTPYQATSELFQDKTKEDWAKYYDYKGEYWMEQKRYEMDQSIQNNSLDKWIDLAKSNQNVHQYYYLQGKAPDLNGKYVFTCDLYTDIKKYEKILSHDIVLKKFLQKFPHSISSSGGIDESRPPQSHVFYEYEESDVYGSLSMRVFEGENTVPCIVPRAYTLTYSNESIDIEIRNSDVDTGEILEFLDSLYSYQSPLKQHAIGILYDEIQCKSGFELVAKMTSADPKCVKPESVQELVIRGWASTNKSLELVNSTKYMIDKNDNSFELQYSLNGATLESIVHDVDANSVLITLDESVGGNMIISLPYGLVDAQIGQSDVDDSFFLLIDGEENLYGEMATETGRIITIWFPNGAHDVEIIRTSWM